MLLNVSECLQNISEHTYCQDSNVDKLKPSIHSFSVLILTAICSSVDRKVADVSQRWLCIGSVLFEILRTRFMLMSYVDHQEKDMFLTWP